MNGKVTMCASALVLLLTAVQAQAQLGVGNVSKINAARLQRVTALAEKSASKGLPTYRVPFSVVASGYTALTPITIPVDGNNVNASVLYRVHNMYQKAKLDRHPYASLQDIANRLRADWAHLENRVSKYPAFYDDQSVLAQDLNAFYDGSGVAVTAPNEELAKLYSLPVDGTLYQPAGYAEPVVLTAQSDFVIYYPRTRTGQLVHNTPQMRAALNRPGKSGSFEEVISLGGKWFEMPQGEPDWNFLKGVKNENLADDVVTGDFIDVENLPAVNHAAGPRMDYKTQVDHARQAKELDGSWLLTGGVKHYTSQNQLGRDMAAFYEGWEGVPQVYHRISNEKFYVYEIPVDGLTYAPEGSPRVQMLDPNTQVVLYSKKIGGQVVDRSLLKNDLIFGDVK